MTRPALPVVAHRRVLIPGQRMRAVSPNPDLGVGDRVVVVLEDHQGKLASVGTVAAVLTDQPVLELLGESLVRLLTDGPVVEVEPVDAPGVDAGDLVDRAQTALRRHMAVRVEAGDPGDVAVEIGPDPVDASHAVASYLQISWPEIQDILDAGDVVARLRREILVLDRETMLLRAVLAKTGT